MNGINLTSFDLRRIADALDQLSKSGAHVESAIVGSHRIHLERRDGDQRDGPWYTVVGIERADH